MARRTRFPDDHFNELLSKLEALIPTPIEPIAQKLKQDVLLVQGIGVSDEKQIEAISAFVSRVRAILECLPQSCGERFKFDAAMIQSVVESWNQRGTVRLSNAIVPRHNLPWGHQIVPLPSENPEQAHVLNLIHFPGEDDLKRVDLLGYPWMCHELGHTVLFRNDSVFVNSFERSLQQVLGRLRLAGLPDSGSARSKALKILERIQTVWGPTPDHRNWAHELATDIIALWTCGPAFLASFHDVTENPSMNPFQLDQDHPPYAVRLSGILTASKKLGWNDQAIPLTKTLQFWSRGRAGFKRTNDFFTLADPQLVLACVSAAIEICKKVDLPQATQRDLDRLNGLIRQNETPEFGVDLILASWLVRESGDEESYARWESQTVRESVKYVTL